MTDLHAVKAVVERLHGCQARHVESVPIKESFQGKTVWEGVVEVFDLKDCPQANRGYAWAFDDGGETRYMVVLHKPPVDGPRRAVQVAIASEYTGYSG